MIDKNLDYNKPIMARGKSKHSRENKIYEFILLPHIKEGSYDIKGWDWFLIGDFEYNSCIFFANKVMAVEEYDKSGYKIFNGELKMTKSRSKKNA